MQSKSRPIVLSRTIVLSLLMAACLALIGCDGVSEEPDASVAADGSLDAGPPTVDAGPADAGVRDAAMVDAGTDAGPLGAYGEECRLPADCEGDACLRMRGEETGFCSRSCDLSGPNPCRDLNTLCIRVSLDPVESYCLGPEIDTGDDSADDGNLSLGDCLTRNLVPLGSDRDLFLVRAETNNPIRVQVTPGPGSDVRLEFYDGAGALIANTNSNGAGGVEALRFDSWVRESIAYVVVIDAGSTIANSYQICVNDAS